MDVDVIDGSNKKLAQDMLSIYITPRVDTKYKKGGGQGEGQGQGGAMESGSLVKVESQNKDKRTD